MSRKPVRPAPGRPEGKATASAQLAAAQARLAATLEALEAAVQRGASEAAAKPPAAASVPEKTSRLMDWMRADLAARYFGAPPSPNVEPLPLSPPPPSVAIAQARPVDIAFPAEPAAAAFLIKDRYSLDELLGFDDEVFLRNAFRAVLRREPDPDGFEHYRWTLLDGRLTRRELLAELRRSPEGRAAKVRIDGLGGADFLHALRRVPLLRHLAAIALSAWRLPGLARRLERLEGDVLRRDAQGARSLERFTATAATALRAMERDRAEVAGVTAAALRSLDAGRLELRSHVQTLQSTEQALRRWAGVFGENLAVLHRLVARLKEASARQASRDEVAEAMQPVLEALRAVADLAADMEAQKGGMALVEAGAKQALVQAAAYELAQRAILAEQREKVERLAQELRERFGTAPADAALDAFYVDFENRFRGTRDDIRSRVQVYLPDVKAALAASGGGSVVDIGSGRGEWLEVLKENRIAALGVDSNAAMARDSRELGLEVIESDGLRYLRGLRDGSVGAITGFHVIEHLEFAQLVALFDESFRVLKQGGVVVFETPNPENVLVGSCGFWYDPTHVRPLPPDVTQHLAESSRFARVEIRRIHPAPEWDRLQAGDEALRDRMNTLFYGPRDYAVIAHKP